MILVLLLIIIIINNNNNNNNNNNDNNNNNNSIDNNNDNTNNDSNNNDYNYNDDINQACKAGEGIIGHREIRFFCLSVCLSIIKLFPAYGTDHDQNAYTGSLSHCEGQSRFDIEYSPIPRPHPHPQKKTPPK